MADSLTLFHISDLHFGREDKAALDWVRTAITRQKPAAIALTGDLTMRARHREFAAARDWLTGLPAPVMVEVGNHDMPYFDLWERFTEPYRRFYGMQAKVVEAGIDLPGLTLVSLRTTARAQWRFPWSEGWITEGALAQTLAVIDTLPTGTRVLVTAHHPLPERSAQGKLLTRGGERALAELAKRKVLAVLSGHVHDPFDLMQDTSEGPIRMIGAGTLSLRTRSTPVSFNELVVAGDQVVVKVHTMDAGDAGARVTEGR